MINKIDSFVTGFITGLIFPVITVIVIYLVRFDHYDFLNFLKQIFIHGIAGKVISLCALPNLLIFFICIWTDKLKIARGIIGSTLFIALIILLLKIF